MLDEISNRRVLFVDDDERMHRAFRRILHGRTGIPQSAGPEEPRSTTCRNRAGAPFEISFAFSAWSMPERVMAALGIDPAKARADQKFNGLRALGGDIGEVRDAVGINPLV